MLFFCPGAAQRRKHLRAGPLCLAHGSSDDCKHTVDRQLDCLRQLVVVLCERSQLQDLVQFPYVNLHDEVSPPPSDLYLTSDGGLVGQAAGGAF